MYEILEWWVANPDQHLYFFSQEYQNSISKQIIHQDIYLSINNTSTPIKFTIIKIEFSSKNVLIVAFFSLFGPFTQ